MKQSYPGYKFQNLRDILLYTIARNKKPMNINEIYGLHSEIPKNTVYLTLRKLELEEKLIKKQNKYSRGGILFSLNKTKLDKIKKILGEHWESGWEVDWKYA